MKSKYNAPRIVRQGSAVSMTAATEEGSCFDGNSGHLDDKCKCSGSGSSCQKDAE